MCIHLSLCVSWDGLGTGAKVTHTHSTHARTHARTHSTGASRSSQCVRRCHQRVAVCSSQGMVATACSSMRHRHHRSSSSMGLLRRRSRCSSSSSSSMGLQRRRSRCMALRRPCSSQRLAQEIQCSSSSHRMERPPLGNRSSQCVMTCLLRRIQHRRQHRHRRNSWSSCSNSSGLQS